MKKNKCKSCDEPVDMHHEGIAPGIVWVDGIGDVEPCSKMKGDDWETKMNEIMSAIHVLASENEQIRKEIKELRDIADPLVMDCKGGLIRKSEAKRSAWVGYK